MSRIILGNSPSLKQVQLAANSSGGADLAELSGVDALRGMVAEQTHAKAMFLTGEGGLDSTEVIQVEGEKQW